MICGRRGSGMGIRGQRSRSSPGFIFPGVFVPGNDSAVHPLLSSEWEPHQALEKVTHQSTYFHPAPSIFSFLFIIKVSATTTQSLSPETWMPSPTPPLPSPPAHPSISSPLWLAGICAPRASPARPLNSPMGYGNCLLSILLSWGFPESILPRLRSGNERC